MDMEVLCRINNLQLNLLTIEVLYDSSHPPKLTPDRGRRNDLTAVCLYSEEILRHTVGLGSTLSITGTY